MPPLRPFVFITDYSPSDLATMLQSGGVQLLDVQTLRALRDDESVIRWGLARMARYQKLSDELIVPNLDQDISFFYDPTTKKLRKRFEIYPEALQETVNFANELERTHTELLKRIQAERQQNRKMNPILRVLVILLSILVTLFASAADYPAPTESDFPIRDFKFASGETLPELRLHYRTLGNRKRMPRAKRRMQSSSCTVLLGAARNLFAPSLPANSWQGPAVRCYKIFHRVTGWDWSRKIEQAE